MRQLKDCEDWDEVRVFSRSIEGRTIKTQRGRLIKNIKLDCFETHDFLAHFEPLNEHILIHSAWCTGINYRSSHENEALLKATRVLFKNVVQKLGSNVVIVGMGSCLEYGVTESPRVCNEDAVCTPTCSYGINKLKLLESLKRTSELHGHSYLWLRPFYTYSHDDKPWKLIPSIISALRAENQFVLRENMHTSFINVEDVVGGILHLILTGKRGIYNIANMKVQSTRDILQKLVELSVTGRRSLETMTVQNQGKTMYLIPSIEKILGSGWVGRHDFDVDLANIYQSSICS